jgi:hypothetical protein
VKITNNPGDLNITNEINGNELMIPMVTIGKAHDNESTVTPVSVQDVNPVSPDPTWSLSATSGMEINFNNGNVTQSIVKDCTSIADDNPIFCNVDNENTASFVKFDDEQLYDDIAMHHDNCIDNCSDDDASLFAGLNDCYEAASVAAVDDLLLDSIVGFEDTIDWL